MARIGTHPEDQFGFVEDSKFQIAVDDVSRFRIEGSQIIVDGTLIVSGSSIPMSGVVENFDVTGILNVSGSMRNPVGRLILNDDTYITGSLTGSTVVVFPSASFTTRVAAATGSVDRLSVISLTASDGIKSSGDVAAVGDLTAAGGFAHSIVFRSGKVLQNAFTDMTGAISGDVTFKGVPMLRAGSVLGFIVRAGPNETVKSGSLSASLTVNNANIAGTKLIVATASLGGVYQLNTFAKDTYTFVAGDRIGISLSGTSDYLCEPDIYSASFIATILVEM